jgi:hypothetical protein
MRQMAEGVRVLRGFPPNALNVYPVCFGHGPPAARRGLAPHESAIAPLPDSSSPLRH